MIEFIASVTVLTAFAFIVCWFSDVIHKKTIVTCRCGRHQSQELLLFDASDEARIKDTLSELCVCCRAAQYAPQQGEVSHA